MSQTEKGGIFMSKKDTQSRKWQITINNPQEKGLNHEQLKLILNDFKSLRNNYKLT